VNQTSTSSAATLIGFSGVQWAGMTPSWDTCRAVDADALLLHLLARSSGFTVSATPPSVCSVAAEPNTSGRHASLKPQRSFRGRRRLAGVPKGATPTPFELPPAASTDPDEAASGWEHVPEPPTPRPSGQIDTCSLPSHGSDPVEPHGDSMAASPLTSSVSPLPRHNRGLSRSTVLEVSTESSARAPSHISTPSPLTASRSPTMPPPEHNLVGNEQVQSGEALGASPPANIEAVLQQLERHVAGEDVELRFAEGEDDVAPLVLAASLAGVDLDDADELPSLESLMARARARGVLERKRRQQKAGDVRRVVTVRAMPKLRLGTRPETDAAGTKPVARTKPGEALIPKPVYLPEAARKKQPLSPPRAPPAKPTVSTPVVHRKKRRRARPASASPLGRRSPLRSIPLSDGRGGNTSSSHQRSQPRRPQTARRWRHQGGSGRPPSARRQHEPQRTPSATPPSPTGTRSPLSHARQRSSPLGRRTDLAPPSAPSSRPQRQQAAPPSSRGRRVAAARRFHTKGCYERSKAHPQAQAARPTGAQPRSPSSRRTNASVMAAGARPPPTLTMAPASGGADGQQARRMADLEAQLQVLKEALRHQSQERVSAEAKLGQLSVRVAGLEASKYVCTCCALSFSL